MSGYDSRIASAFVGLGYDLFPFEAFDGAGRLRVPGSVDYPSHIRDGLGVVAQAPIWQGLYRTLSVLDDPQWNVFSAGVGFGSRTVNVALFTSLSSVRNAAAAHQWSISYQTVVARTLRSFAGQNYLVDPKWLTLVGEALERASAGQTPTDPEVEATHEGPAGLADDDRRAAAAAAGGWLVLGLRALLGVLQNFTRKREIRTTVFWYTTDKSPRADKAFAGAWTPMHVDYMHEGALRTVHGLWDPSPPAKVWWGNDVPWSRLLWAMPHEPWQWCRALYPTGNCGGPGLASRDELILEARSPQSGPRARRGLGQPPVHPAL